MDDNAKRYARRILLVHALLLVVVLLTVMAAAREIYVSTRDQLVREAEKRQQMLAKQTASGIESHYQSILNDLDLLRQAANDETGAEKAGSEKTSTELAADMPAPPALTPQQRAERQAARAAGKPLPPSQPSSIFTAASSLFNQFTSRSPLIGLVMWKQVSGRVSLLFTINHPGMSKGVVEVHEVGSDDDRLKMLDIVQQSREWIDQQKTPAFSKFETYNGVGGNLICIPMARGRDLLAMVPIAGIQKQFLQPLNDDPASGAWLIDEAGVAMAASRPQLVGTTVTGITDPEFYDLARKFVIDHEDGTVIVNRKFRIGSADFVPAMISAKPVNVGKKKWELFVTTSLEDVDGLVAKLFRRALWWCVFVVVSITGILVSTSIQMIRSRLRMERVRHEMLTRELSQARQIQLAWLPDRQPSNAAIDVAALNQPASHISGDFYNWFELPDGRLVVTVGDVTGHGMSAAFLMATTQLLVRNTMVRLADPARCLEEVNRQLCVQVFNGQFVTMLVVIIDTKRQKLLVATAGHPAPLLADGESFQPMPIEPQLVLGVDRETKYVTESYDLPPQASLLLFTDGVVECPDAVYARFGDERLRRCLYGRYENAQTMLDQVTNAINDFRGARVLDDDLTLVAVQLTPKASVKRPAVQPSRS
jgi:serine phosphatase RsbU (regulator of sigma subunit)